MTDAELLAGNEPTLNGKKLSQIYAEQMAHRLAANCFDIFEAAKAIAVQLGYDKSTEEELRDDMSQAAHEGTLTVRSPRGHDQYAPTRPPSTTYGFDCLVTPDDVNEWATERRLPWKWIVQAPAQTAATPAPVVAVGALGGEAWVNKARKRAAEIIKRQREKDLFPSQENLGDEIAKEFRTAGIVGADGKPLSGAYIKRHALNGISSATGKQLSTRTGRGK